jgi:putative endonuclease
MRHMEHCYYVYILGSKSRTLYIGVTNDLVTRIRQHRSGVFGGFTSDYRIHRLVYYEVFRWVQEAIAREKQLKRWRREKKVALIERENPTWEDLSAIWFQPAKLKVRDPRTESNSRSLHSD